MFGVKFGRWISDFVVFVISTHELLGKLEVMSMRCKQGSVILVAYLFREPLKILFVELFAIMCDYGHNMRVQLLLSDQSENLASRYATHCSFIELLLFLLGIGLPFFAPGWFVVFVLVHRLGSS